MKKLLAVVLIAIIASCSNETDNPETREEIQKQISEYKSQVGELNKKIADLEKQLTGDKESSRQTVAVSIKEIQKESFNHYIQVNGTVEAVEAAFISPEINGQVKKIYVKEGQRVNRGDLLLKINSSITESSIKEVETALELATTVYEKQKQLWDKNIGSELDYLSAKNNKESMESKLETLKAQAEMAMVKAPIDAIVDEILAKEGELAIPGVRVIDLVNLSELFVNVDVADTYITKVKKNDPVVLEFPSFPGYRKEVPVHRVGNIIKTANRTFTVQLKIENKDEMLKPNAIAVVKINDFSEPEAFVVPSIIVKEDLTGYYVYLAIEKNGNLIASKRYIKTGMSYQDKTMVVEGLKANDKVIVQGYNQVSDGVEINIAKS